MRLVLVAACCNICSISTRMRPFFVIGSCGEVSLINGMVALMNYDGQDAPEPVNMGSTNEISMNELVSTLSAILKRDVEVEYHPLPQDDPVRRRPDPSRASARLGWSPKVDLEQGMMQTVAFFRDLLAKASKG